MKLNPNWTLCYLVHNFQNNLGMKKLYIYEVKQKAARFLACKKISDLYRLGFNTNALQLLAIDPPYYHFEVRKKSGGMRKIEAPEEDLKQIQKQLSDYLQCVYYSIQSKAAYGYIIRVRASMHHKNILGNARQHHGAKYLLNADFKNFFHQIKTAEILRIFQTTPFNFNKKTAHLLSRLVTRKGRLPMGAPTSPVLSNIATLPLDKALSDWATQQTFKYTRFVDDLTFSSKNLPINQNHFVDIQELASQYGFEFNINKTKFFQEHQTKKVTGLLLNTTIDIDPKFYRAIDKNLKRLKMLVEVKQLLDNYRPSGLVSEFKQRVDGQINFIGMIEGYDSPEFRKYRKRMERTLKPSKEVLSARWVNLSYF